MANFTAHAKWILSGEHSVVRGGKAIAFPLKSYSNLLTFEKSRNLSIITNSPFDNEVVLDLLETSSEFLSIPLKKISGCITVESNIPVRRGLGSSAAICVNVARVFECCGYCNDTFQLARHLEDKFHQKSSGLDISVALENKPVVFFKNQITEFLKPSFWPCMILTHSGTESVTSNCAKIIREIFNKNEKKALELDNQMSLASDLCEQALKNADFYKLRDGIALGNEVFNAWGLCNSSMSLHMKELLSNGAVAVKPVGSGLGGYILSLWDEKPKKYEDICLTLTKP